MRVIGMDIHRVFAEVAALLDGQATRLGRVDMRRDRLEAFARSTLTHDDHVVVEATGNAAAVVEVLRPTPFKVLPGLGETGPRPANPTDSAVGDALRTRHRPSQQEAPCMPSCHRRTPSKKCGVLS